MNSCGYGVERHGKRKLKIVEARCDAEVKLSRKNCDDVLGALPIQIQLINSMSAKKVISIVRADTESTEYKRSLEIFSRIREVKIA